MKRIVIFCALCALFGCRQANTPQAKPIALYYSIAEQSKTDLLTPGDQIGVFSNIEGTEHYFLENVPFVVGADGRSLSTSPAVYYPEAKQAVVFTAYLPFGGAWSGALGTFSVPSDQTTAPALKQADLCWATASSTPVAAPVALEFRHQMARLLITTNEPTEKIAIPNVFSGGILDIKTGAFTNTLRSEVFTTGNELILPAQTVTRLVLTVAGIEYVFEGAMVLESARTTSISLTLNPTTHTATLSGSSTTDWVASTASGNPTQAVSNVLTMHWPNYLPQGATPDKVTLTINNTDYTVSSGITYADQTFTVPFASSALRYPYTITKVAFTNLPPCTQLLGATIYKSAAQTLGIKDPANAVLINGIWWATGNLIADGPNGCRIGAPTDCGLYFQFGSLIGWSGGAAPTYDGSGLWSNHTATIKVRPSNFNANFDPGSSWPTNGSGSALTQSYFSVNLAPYATQGTSILDYIGAPTSGVGVDDTKATLGTGRYAPMGVGDPCTFYLGASWHLPKLSDIQSLTWLAAPYGWVSPFGASVVNGPPFTITRSGASLTFAHQQPRTTSASTFYDGSSSKEAYTTTNYISSGSASGIFGFASTQPGRVSALKDETSGTKNYRYCAFGARCVN